MAAPVQAMPPVQAAPNPIIVQGAPQPVVISNQVIQGPTYMGDPIYMNQGPGVNQGTTYLARQPATQYRNASPFTQPATPAQTATTLPPPDNARFPKGEQF